MPRIATTPATGPCTDPLPRPQPRPSREQADRRGLVERPPPRLATRRALGPDSTVENVVGRTVSCSLAGLVLSRRLGLGLL
jgi:hypothetical protein